DIGEAVAEADVIMMLRIQQERMTGAFIPSLREYFNTFGMTTARVAKAKPDVIIMHPGPMNRGVEIASDVADGPYSVILEQVANGVAVRMAVLYLLAGGVEYEVAASGRARRRSAERPGRRVRHPHRGWTDRAHRVRSAGRRRRHRR